MDVEKCHDEVAVEDRTGRELAGEDSTKDTWIHVSPLSPMAMGKRKRHTKQASIWVATQDLPRSAAHPFYTRVNQILDEHDFDEYVEERCQRFYSDEERPGCRPDATSGCC